MTAPASPWDEYLHAAGELDAVRQDAAAAVVRQQHATAEVAEDIAAVRERIAGQRAHLAHLATRLGIGPPGIEPSQADRSTAAQTIALADPTASIVAAVRDANVTLDEADATLATVAGSRRPVGLLATWPPLLRNGIVYFWFAALTMVAIAEINQTSGPSQAAGTLVTAFSVLIPACAWAVAWLSAGMLFAPDEQGRRPRSALLGLLLCGVPLVVGLMLAAR